jgi:hypothetical protein
VAAAAPVRCSAVSSHRPEVGWALRLQLAAVEAAPAGQNPGPAPPRPPAAACGASRRVARDAYTSMRGGTVRCTYESMGL